jgi:hypothetical protein
MRAVPGIGLFKENGVPHFNPACFRTLFCVSPLLCRMLALTVAPFLVYQTPAITLDDPNCVANLHGSAVALL